jgi:glycosyltransferase involved in cell wall biosynthesis
MSLESISVVIPSYNMAWCISRAIKSCQAQSLSVEEIIVLDDCSTDDTEAIVGDLVAHDSRIRYHRLETNVGHLSALRVGVGLAVSDWIALLDADDELTPWSIEARVIAAKEYMAASGVKPQLVYGDHDNFKFTQLRGFVFPYLCKELSLCQTSTIMLGRECVPFLPKGTTRNNNDDRVVLAVGEHFDVLHCSQAVATYHPHDSPTRVTNNPKRVFDGVYMLVRDYRAKIVQTHGIKLLFLWYIRVFKSFVRYRIDASSARIASMPSTFFGQYLSFVLKIYRKGLTYLHLALRIFLKHQFDLNFF